jgi:hypothetical protein
LAALAAWRIFAKKQLLFLYDLLWYMIDICYIKFMLFIIYIYMLAIQVILSVFFQLAYLLNTCFSRFSATAFSNQSMSCLWYLTRESNTVDTKSCCLTCYCQKTIVIFIWFVVIYDWYLLYKIHVIYNIYIYAGNTSYSYCFILFYAHLIIDWLIVA